MEKMRANPKVREWWAMTDGMQVYWSNGRKWDDADVFLLAGESHSWRCGQCRGPWVVEGPGRGLLHRMNFELDGSIMKDTYETLTSVSHVRY